MNDRHIQMSLSDSEVWQRHREWEQGVFAMQCGCLCSSGQMGTCRRVEKGGGVIGGTRVPGLGNQIVESWLGICCRDIWVGGWLAGALPLHLCAFEHTVQLEIF